MRKLMYVLLLFWAISVNAQNNRQFYLIKLYHFATHTQQKATEDFLQKAWLPAVHKKGIKQVGVFTPVGNDTATKKKIYLFIPLVSLNDVYRLDDALLKDPQYLSAGATYIQAAHDQPAYSRIETFVLRAFSDMPHMAKPVLSGPVEQRIYELRSYEGATEKLYRKKVDMFNQGGEIKLFKQLAFNAVFYGEVLAGSRMPNLMYMTSFDNMDERDKHWKIFFDHPEWKRLSALPEYQHTVSKVDIILLNPTSYSDL
ncbi:MAG TPA: NIPSNAP family containing protein [Chitinophagaceae bacterium]|nr:NIPSNAP family containing protein [Chitinophagaceae bacterium]